MAFPQANAQRELTNRKILEDIQLKKQLLLKQGVVSTLNTTSTISPSIAAIGGATIATTTTTTTTSLITPTILANEQTSDSINSVQRQALKTANQQSTGYFIAQDSSFGNMILPVLPRFENNKLVN